MIQARMAWTIDPNHAVNRLTTAIRNRVLRIALNAASAPVKAAVIASAPVREGPLKKATGIKIWNPKNGPTWVAIIGAKSKFKQRLRRNGKLVKSKTPKTGQKRYAVPGRYQRLVDQGGKFLTGRQYMSRALAISQQQFQAVARVKLSQLLAPYLNA